MLDPRRRQAMAIALAGGGKKGVTDTIDFTGDGVVDDTVRFTSGGGGGAGAYHALPFGTALIEFMNALSDRDYKSPYKNLMFGANYGGQFPRGGVAGLSGYKSGGLLASGVPTKGKKK